MNKFYMHNPISVLENGTHELLFPNLVQTTRPNNKLKKNGTSKIVDFAVPADHSVKLKESEK